MFKLFAKIAYYKWILFSQYPHIPCMSGIFRIREYIEIQEQQDRKWMYKYKHIQ